MKRLPVVALFSAILVTGLVLTGSVVAGALAYPSGGTASIGASGRVGHGMMGSFEPGSMMGWKWQQSSAPTRALTIGQAQHRVQLYIHQYGNRHLVIDEIMEFQRNFYVIAKDTRTGHGAFEVLVNKWTGLVFPEYGPAMMWNTQYGIMQGGMMGHGSRRGPMIVSPTQAASIARQWLTRNRPSMTIEAPDQFPGYYTVHFRRNGTIAGMLSVNGYTGQVWYHTWHGTFIRMKTVNG